MAQKPAKIDADIHERISDRPGSISDHLRTGMNFYIDMAELIEVQPCFSFMIKAGMTPDQIVRLVISRHIQIAESGGKLGVEGEDGRFREVLF